MFESTDRSFLTCGHEKYELLRILERPANVSPNDEPPVMFICRAYIDARLLIQFEEPCSEKAPPVQFLTLGPAFIS